MSNRPDENDCARMLTNVDIGTAPSTPEGLTEDEVEFLQIDVLDGVPLRNADGSLCGMWIKR